MTSATATKQTRAFLNFLFALALVGLALYAGTLFSNTDKSPLADSPSASPELSIFESTPTSPETSTRSARQLVVLATVKTAQQLVLIDSENQSRQTIFTDRDEKNKIKQVGNLTADGKEVLVLMGSAEEPFGGSLYTIATDGSGRLTLLFDNFASPWPPVFSPDGKKIAYVFFSNAETESGYFLVIANRNGTNKRELVRETKPITQPVFAPDGHAIAYVREQAPSGGSIMTVPLTGGTPKEAIRYTDRVPYDLTWAKDDGFYFIDGQEDRADLYAVKTGDIEPHRLTTPAGRESRPVISADGQTLAFASRSSATATPVIYLLHLETGSTQTLGSGTLPIGWIEQ